MEKVKAINHISNNKKTMLLDIQISEKNLKLLEKIFLKFHDIPLLEIETKDHEFIETYSLKTWIGRTIILGLGDSREESGFIIFKSKYIEIILLRNSKYCKDIEKEIFDVFDFIDPPKIKTKKKHKK